jgi:hypothetical protein
MKGSILLQAAVVGAVAGAGSAVLTSSALSTETVETQAAAVPGGPSSAELDDLRDQSAQLAERLRLLEGQLALASDRRAEVAHPDPTRATQVDLEQLEAMVASLNRPDLPAPAGLQRWVEQALEDKQAREKAERELEERIKREERLDERMVEITEKLGLDGRQTEEVRNALWERDEARGAFFRDMRGGGFAGLDREAIRASMTTITTNANTALQSSLSPAQFELYQKEYPGRGDRGRGGRDG